MKIKTSGPIAAAALVTASFFATPCGALPMAGLAAVPDESSAQMVAWGRYHRRHALIPIAPGLYYGCRPGWYCFGPPYRPWFTRAWYGGFNSQFGYQGGRWRPPERNAEF